MLLADTSATQIVLWIFGGVLDLLLLIITVVIAARKGHSIILYGLFAFFCPIVALIVALAVRPRGGRVR